MQLIRGERRSISTVFLFPGCSIVIVVIRTGRRECSDLGVTSVGLEELGSDGVEVTVVEVIYTTRAVICK